MSDDPATAEYEAHLEALREMPLSVAQRLRSKLLVQRAWIEGQLVIVDQVLAEKASKDGAAAPVQPIPDDALQWPRSPVSGLSQRPSRRIVLLTIMAEAAEQDWTQKVLRRRMVEAGAVTDDVNGTKRTHATVAQSKQKGELEQTGPSLYRITPKGLTAVGR